MGQKPDLVEELLQARQQPLSTTVPAPRKYSPGVLVAQSHLLPALQSRARSKICMRAEDRALATITARTLSSQRGSPYVLAKGQTRDVAAVTGLQREQVQDAANRRLNRALRGAALSRAQGKAAPSQTALRRSARAWIRAGMHRQKIIAATAEERANAPAEETSSRELWRKYRREGQNEELPPVPEPKRTVRKGEALRRHRKRQALLKRIRRRTHPRGHPALENDPDAPEPGILREGPGAGCAAPDRSAVTRSDGASTPAEGKKRKKPRRGLTASQKRRLVAAADPLELFHEAAATPEDSATTQGSVGPSQGTSEGVTGTAAQDQGVVSTAASSSGLPAPIKQLPSPAWRQFQRWVEAASTRAASRQLPAHIRPKGTHQNPRFYRDSIIRPVATMLQEIGTPWSDAADIALHTTGQALAAIALHQDETAQRQFLGPDRQKRPGLMLRSKAAGAAPEKARKVAGAAPEKARAISEKAAGVSPRQVAGPLPKRVPKKVTGAVPSLSVPSLAGSARERKGSSPAGAARDIMIASQAGSARDLAIASQAGSARDIKVSSPAGATRDRKDQSLTGAAREIKSPPSAKAAGGKRPPLGSLARGSTEPQLAGSASRIKGKALAGTASGSKDRAAAGSASGSSKVPAVARSAGAPNVSSSAVSAGVGTTIDLTGAAIPMAGWRHVTAIGSKAAAIKLQTEPPRK